MADRQTNLDLLKAARRLITSCDCVTGPILRCLDAEESYAVVDFLRSKLVVRDVASEEFSPSSEQVTHNWRGEQMQPISIEQNAIEQFAIQLVQRVAVLPEFAEALKVLRQGLPAGCCIEINMPHKNFDPDLRWGVCEALSAAVEEIQPLYGHWESLTDDTDYFVIANAPHPSTLN